MKGIVEICAEILFGLKIEMTVLQINNETNLNQTYQHYIYNVKSLDKLPLFVAPNAKKVVLQVPKEHAEIVTMKDFCLMSPTHICFDKKMLIEHCGEFLQKELGFSSKHPTHLATLFEIIQPDYESMNFKNITKNINAPYMFRLKKNMKRNHKETCDKLLLIGQMYLINNGESLLFINSPYITTAMELKKTNMYISDFSKSDTTRDLIFLNQSRLYRNNAKYVFIF
uniref:guanylate cyclase n=1 Tax=Acrobeloides nanus TaxID=290746 RepID=A0A914D592_9BILA